MNKSCFNSHAFKLVFTLVYGAGWLLSAANASAYIGPGAGLSALGSLLALVLAVFVAIAGFFWYPIKRLVKGRQGPTLEEDIVDDTSTPDQKRDN